MIRLKQNFLLILSLVVLLSCCKCSNGEISIENSGPRIASVRVAEANTTDVPFTKFEDHLQSTSVLYGLTKLAANASVSSDDLCFNELRDIQQSILRKKPWAMKVLDASASKPPGFIFQHNFWLGSYAACNAANVPLKIGLYKALKRTMRPGLMDDVAPFEVGFHVVYLRHNSPWQVQITYMNQPILHLGLCLPKSCSTDAIQRLTLELLQRKLLTDAELYQFRTEILYVKDLKLKEEFFARRSLKIIAAMLIFTSTMIWWAGRSKKAIMEPEFNTKGENADETSSETTPKTLSRGEGKTNSLESFANYFAFSANCRSLFTIRPYTSRDIPIINGVRSIFALCVLMVHIAWFARYTVHSGSLVQHRLEKTTIQLHNVGLYLVDGFLTISGFLHIFLFLREAKFMERIRKNSVVQNIQVFFAMLLHRYLRLAPLYFVVMCVSDVQSAYLNDVSLFHISERNDQTCPQNWWQNIFFIQSYFGFNQMCVQWSWTLSCEMQYFVWATILLMIYAKNQKFAKYAVVALLASSVVWTIIQGVKYKYQLASEGIHLTMDEIYVSPLIRVTPYIVGGVVAWYFLTQERPQHLRPVVEQFLWNFAAMLFFGASYTMNFRDLDYLASISLYTLGRLMMSLAVCLIIIGSAMGSGCWWSRFLESNIFQHFNRLCYAVYMLHPLVISLFAGIMEASASSDMSVTILTGGGLIVLIYLFSILFSLSFEVPYCNWSKALLKGGKKKTS